MSNAECRVISAACLFVHSCVIRVFAPAFAHSWTGALFAYSWTASPLYPGPQASVCSHKFVCSPVALRVCDEFLGFSCVPGARYIFIANREIKAELLQFALIEIAGAIVGKSVAYELLPIGGGEGTEGGGGEDILKWRGEAEALINLADRAG